MREPFRGFITNMKNQTMLLITCGLPGTWKTETAQEIAEIKGCPILRTDLIRLNILKGEDVFDAKVASNMSKRERVYSEMFRQARKRLQKHECVILDATFVTQALRRRAADIAAEHGVTLVILHTSCPEEVSIKRILRRTKQRYESNALTREAYLNNKKMFEPIDLIDLKERWPQLQVMQVTVDTEQDHPEEWYVIGMKIL